MVQLRGDGAQVTARLPNSGDFGNDQRSVGCKAGRVVAGHHALAFCSTRRAEVSDMRRVRAILVTERPCQASISTSHGFASGTRRCTVLSQLARCAHTAERSRPRKLLQGRAVVRVRRQMQFGTAKGQPEGDGQLRRQSGPHEACNLRGGVWHGALKVRQRHAPRRGRRFRVPPANRVRGGRRGTDFVRSSLMMTVARKSCHMQGRPGKVRCSRHPVSGQTQAQIAAATGDCSGAAAKVLGYGLAVCVGLNRQAKTGPALAM